MATAPAPDVYIRLATPQDAEICGRIFHDAFAVINQRHGFPPELPSREVGIAILKMLFSHPEFYSVVAESGGRIVGSNCLDERSTIRGLGPICVEPEFQDRGIGRVLMSALLDRVRERGAAGVRLLQAAFHNRSLSLYTKLGFDAREPVSVMNGRFGGAVEGCTVRPASPADLAVCNELCERVHGFDRAGELRDGVAHGSAVVVEREGRITGYASAFGYFGHAVAEANLDMQALIAAAKDVGGPGILVPTRNAELFRWCLGSGLRVVFPMTLMTIGAYKEPDGAYLPSILY